MANNDIKTVESDLYFLIYNFLNCGPLKNTLKTFVNEINDSKILPKRIDWKGNEHDRTIEDMGRQYTFLPKDFLLELCCRSGLAVGNKYSNSFSLLGLKTTDNKDHNFRQLVDYVGRRNQIPIRNRSCNLINVLRAQEISSTLSRRWIISPKLYSSLQMQRRTLGHLSAVYCVLFDHTGRYIITGADDLLIKLWSSLNGRLIATFRGASSEITDIAINVDNTLLAAGSIDRILRIWDLQTGAPIAVLSGHTGMITSVNFCPSPSWNLYYLITTSTDGSVAFWPYSYDPHERFNFRPKPTVYQEKMRPGQAQMICSSFSPGGTFLATGSADHHVRVYYMKGDEGPHRILETEAHVDRVDSIQWAHSGLRFLSGSKDGTAIIWRFETQQWKTIYLHMAEKQSQCKKINDDSKKLKVTMVAWDQSDNWVITAVSDHTLKVWDARTGQLDKTLSGHTDEIYVLESHPHDRHVILSAGHDGQLFVWDLLKGEIVSRFTNTIEGQGYGAIFDVKWSPDGTVVAATDSHGHLLIFGFGNGNSAFNKLPKELFFHTDYRPLVRDANNYVLDEQTQIAPHLMPPPFLVDIDGNPYPPMLQRLVPGREHCNAEQLVPSIVIGNEGTQEVIQVVNEEHQRHQNEDGLDIRNNTLGNSSRRNREVEGIRQSTGDWQSDPNIKWKKYILVPPLKRIEIQKSKEIIEFMEKLEMAEYHHQICQRPHMISIASNSEAPSKSNDKKQKQTKQSSYRTRLARNLSFNIDHRGFFIKSSSDSSVNEETDLSEYSDWVAEADADVDVKPTKRTRRRQNNYNSDSDGQKSDDRNDNEDDDDEDEDEEELQKVRRPTYSRKEIANGPGRSNGVLPELYRISEWLTEVRPRKTPYFPQMSDELVYFIQGHHLYVNAVKTKNVYEINSKNLPWTKVSLRSHEFVKVVGIQYEIKPPRICCLKLAMLDDGGRLTGKMFTVKYHDMPDVLDFFVLKQNFETAISRQWKIGDKFRCMIDDEWWIGEIVSKSSINEEFPDSPFMCYEIKWDNGEQERMSPWDMEPIDENRVPENFGEALPVHESEIENILYQPMEGDWPNNDRDAVTKCVLAGLSKVMELAIAEPFLVPVDLNTYPTYASIIEYPVDLSTIKARFENRFYRRLTAAQFDIRRLAMNAEKFNERHSIIVKHARILSELCLRIVKQSTTYMDVTSIYHRLVDTYDSTDTEVDVEILPTNSRMLRSLPTRHFRRASDWKTEAKNLVDAMLECEDSVPFRQPVNNQRYPDYHQIIKNPMDLSTVRDNLNNNRYETPHDFCEDVKLIFINSRTYNTNKRSRIYVMTVRMAAIFDEHSKKMINHWKIAKRRTSNRRMNSKTSPNAATASSSSLSTSPDTGDSSDDSDENSQLTSWNGNGRMLRTLPNRHFRAPGDWKNAARKLLDAMWECEESAPFRHPVDQERYPDYGLLIKMPMDLSTVKTKLENDEYGTPNDLYNDTKLIFTNSQTYNTNRRSKIYLMTIKLASIFEDHAAKLIHNWKVAKRHGHKQIDKRKRMSESGTSTPSSSSLSMSSPLTTHSDTEPDEETKRPTRTKQPLPTRNVTPPAPSSSQNSDNDSDDVPLTRLQNNVNNKRVVVRPNVATPNSLEVRKGSDDSGDSYRPESYRLRKRTRGTRTSSEDEDSSLATSDSDERPLSQHASNTRLRNKRKKPKQVIETSENESEDTATNDCNKNCDNFTSVSSRGRVRKLTSRVMAIFAQIK